MSSLFYTLNKVTGKYTKNIHKSDILSCMVAEEKLTLHSV